MGVQIHSSWQEIHERNGLLPLQRSGRNLRGKCPFCESRTGFSESEDEGLFFCFACGVTGDKITFIRLLLKTDFRGALRWYGLETGHPAAPDPNRAKANIVRQNLRQWKRRIGREARDRLYARNTILQWAKDLFEEDPQSEKGWRLLQIALIDYAKDEYIADRVDLADERNEKQLLEVYREFRGIK
jgi:hypothetical protein